MLYNLESERLEIEVVWGNIPAATRDAINEGRLSTKTFAIGEGVAGRAAKLRRPIRLNDRTKIPQVGRNTELDAACELLERYRREIESARFDDEGKELKVTISVGLAACRRRAPGRGSTGGARPFDET